jgi:hypothetical protein
METCDLQSTGTVFARIAARFVARSDKHLVCKQGSYKACSVLKLQKPWWTNDPMDKVENTSGIFFSIWTNEASLRECRANYNIHALKLRELSGYSITSRDFATAFRDGFASVQSGWPNVRVDQGPRTLLEGWMNIDIRHFEEDVLALMARFETVAPLLDGLLETRRR